VAHLDHDDAVLVITGDAPAAALTFGHGPAPFRGSDTGACDEVDLCQRVATAYLERIPAQEPLRVTGRGVDALACQHRRQPPPVATEDGRQLRRQLAVGDRCGWDASRLRRSCCARSHRSQLFGLEYRAGAEPPAPNQPDPRVVTGSCCGTRTAGHSWRSSRPKASDPRRGPTQPCRRCSIWTR
jgi:hypothetical protein